MATSMVTGGVPGMMSAAWVTMAYGGCGDEVVSGVCEMCGGTQQELARGDSDEIVRSSQAVVVVVKVVAVMMRGCGVSVSGVVGGVGRWIRIVRVGSQVTRNMCSRRNCVWFNWVVSPICF